MTQITWINNGAVSAEKISIADKLLRYIADYYNTCLARPINWDIKVTIDDSNPLIYGSSDYIYSQNLNGKYIFDH